MSDEEGTMNQRGAVSGRRAAVLASVLVGLVVGCSDGERGAGTPGPGASDVPRVDESPVLRVEAVPARGVAPLYVDLLGQAVDPDGVLHEAVWDLGDGTAAAGLDVRHAYMEEGVYRATLRAVDECGQVVAATVQIVVGDTRVRHRNHYPTRLAAGPGGRLYVGDARADAVFVYDAGMELIAEIAGPLRPLGVAVGPTGDLYVGSDGSDRVEVYDDLGRRTAILGEGWLEMPNDLLVDGKGQVYVGDSRADRVRVFDADGAWVRDIGESGDGEGQLRFPTALALDPEPPGGREPELFVADQANGRVQVFTVHGQWLRQLGERAEAFSEQWEGCFAQLQALEIDDQGRLHALDAYMNVVQRLDAESGAFVDAYGSFGREPGGLNVPLDLVLVGDRALVASAENHRVEVLHASP